MSNFLFRKSFLRIFSLLCFLLILFSWSFPVLALEESTSSNTQTETSFHVDAPCALLMEASTGTVLFEQAADEERAPASVTKVMTLLLIFDALASGQISLNDTVSVSEHASSMGGSQVFLETGETQTVETMIKCIAVASGNDAAVAMAEYISGSEEAFVSKMNARAKELGMTHTHFINCCGLDAEGHYTSARDIALMSRELTTSYPAIFDYTTIWMENITHVTIRGSSEFGLTNTNKLIRQYDGATGLKTGSTSKAGFCLSATATKNDISLIAVVMGCSSSKVRIAATSALLDYGFSICHIFTDENPPVLSPVSVRQGAVDTISCEYDKTFSYVATQDFDASKIKRKLRWNKNITAPLKKGDAVGELIYYYDSKKLGSIFVMAKESVKKATYFDYFRKLVASL
ncbi:MAG: D-alanyl-D-alanine carboxypeptidase family protein [Anaerobutyricum sp.]|nr:D-alanyl-D-alanine carboxypeptidase [Eubacterium sp.]MDY6047755.1 D-alanyl-D-alanine carboxypeptidase family protein [Anaerobutyricum sp.]